MFPDLRFDRVSIHAGRLGFSNKRNHFFGFDRSTFEFSVQKYRTFPKVLCQLTQFQYGYGRQFLFFEIGDEIYEVEKDNVVFIPAGVPHWYEVEGSEPFQFLCMVPNGDDTIKIIE